MDFMKTFDYNYIKLIQAFFRKRRFKHLQHNLHLEFLALATLCSGALLGQQDSLDVGENSALSDGDSCQQLVQLLVITDSELEIIEYS